MNVGTNRRYTDSSKHFPSMFLKHKKKVNVMELVEEPLLSVLMS